MKPAFVAESPVWCARDGILYWLDLLGQRLHRRRGGDGSALASHDLSGGISTIALRASGGLIAASTEGFGFIDPTTGGISRMASAPWGCNEVPNDGKCDPCGRFWVGTKDASGGLNTGAIYCLEPTGSCIRCAEGYGNVNGFGWSPDGKTMYVADTRRGEIHAYAFNRKDRTPLGEKRVFVRVPQEYGRPDGLTVDAEGCLWSANWQGGSVIRYAPTGAMIETVRLAAPCPTSCIFGGSAFETLYVTVAEVTAELALPETGGDSRQILALNVGVRGLEEFRFGG